MSVNDTIDVLKKIQDYLDNLVVKDEKEWHLFDMAEMRKIRNSYNGSNHSNFRAK